MDFKEVKSRALEIKTLYDQKNKKDGEKKWESSEYLQGFVGDVGELAKLVMAKEGYRKADSVDDRISHELADCLWSVMVLANEFDIDLEKEFIKTMDKLEQKIQNES